MTSVSVITPTYNREAFHRRLLYCIRTQTFDDFEWLVLDDSPQPSRLLSTISAPWISYTHIERSLSLGEKRNWLVRRAKGDVIIQFDDDDYYSPNYISTMYSFMELHTLDFANLRAWYLLDLRHAFLGYWDLTNKEGIHFRLAPDNVGVFRFGKPGNLDKLPALEADMHLGWGFGYAYRKHVWERSKFTDKDWNEEMALSLFADKHLKSAGLIDTSGLCLHLLHPGSTSVCFPQFHLPKYILNDRFPGFQIA